MAIFTSSLAAASAVGVNHLRDEPYTTSNVPRVLRGAAFVGSAAVNDAGVELKVNQVTVAKIYNTRAGANVIPNRDDFLPIGVFIPAGALLSAPMFDAGITNATYLALDVVDYVRGR